MRRWIIVGVVIAAGAIAGPLLLHERAAPARRTAHLGNPAADPPKPPHQEPAVGHHDDDDDDDCSGCSLKNHKIPHFSAEAFRAALRGYAGEALPSASGEGKHPSLERLLFYGERTRLLIEAHPRELSALPARHRELLMRELARSDATVTLRLVDEHGTTRASTGVQRVPLGKKQHLHAHRLDRLQPLEFNGTVLRVGLHHLWSRY